MHSPMPGQRYTSHASRLTLLDWKRGDVTGDGIVDNVYLYGDTSAGAGNFADHITLVIEDGFSHKQTKVPLKNNAGYHARLFLGDFSKDNVPDILVSIDSGGSGGYGFFYIYSCKNNILHEMFDVDHYNQAHKFHVNYEDFYKVGVGSPTLDVLFTIDISNKGYDYVSKYYFENGKLKQPVTGEVLALGALYPIVTNEKRMGYDILAFQRIIGTTNADTLGYVENLLTWNGTQFQSMRLTVAILGTKLISLY
ncbi:VCBS repeat-containing protein [Brevibacillus ruminantium]|uniref:VCBS repeat-containing protein n=1 Tax=Brevibacillus ruminantium TaxID=2950604 RepID=A0ABY4WBE1_9BACL|nr:VCBS repeat-containing protein [Brevibacillus ruminantium]USG64368.1 VCBS repeat-containing protein [Brevibacillus ruminantium]